VMTSDLQRVNASDFRNHGGTYFLKGESSMASLPPIFFKLSARYTLPVVASATMCECSENGLNDIGSCI